MYDDLLRTLDEDKKKVFVSILHHIIYTDDCQIDDKALLMDEIMAFTKSSFDLDKDCLSEDALASQLDSIKKEEWLSLNELIRLTVLAEEDAPYAIAYEKSLLEKTQLSFQDKNEILTFLKEGDVL